MEQEREVLLQKIEEQTGMRFIKENLGVPKNHISQLMGHEDGNMALDVYSGGLAIEPLRESMRKLSYGEEIDNHLNKGIIR